VLPYTSLIFATGARNRELPTPGIDLPGIHGLRTLADAEQLGAALDTARNVVVVGAGFIGLEFATAALARGCHVTVLEFAPRPM
ncbi:NAD(P)/FAD-dependent oxidoreductase, partial [Bacillus thuringiensis]|nr:NAD(P)/FAD-dependent oxidoreductase [Bacillus thuringiensis]